MDYKIIDFLKKQTSASVSCVNEMLEPYSFSCFFAFNAEQKLLYYKSAPSSYHSRILSNQPKVAGTIMPDKLNKLAIRGIQFTGDLLPDNDPLCKHAADIYYRKFPIGLAIPGIVYTIRLEQLKMTNNIVGMMEKLSWQREEILIANNADADSKTIKI
jgi:uncharacterized protein YhbP (UPF0306 family)